MIKKILSVVAIATMGFSASFTVMPYGSYIDYSDSAAKDYGVLAGAYGGYYSYPYKVDFDVEYLKLNYKNGTPDYYQRDLTVAGHYYIGDSIETHAGIHNIFISQDGNDNNYQKVLFGGVLYYKYLKYNAGIDYYYSTYKGFNVKQATLKMGYNFANYYQIIGSIYGEVHFNFINISDKETAGTTKDNYFNTDLILSNTKGPWNVSFDGSLGKSAYKVANGGFVVYNLKEEYKYSYGVSLKYALTNNSAVTASYTRSRFTEDGDNVFSNIVLFSYSVTF